MKRHNLDMEQLERSMRNLLRVWVGMLLIAIVVLLCLIRAEETLAVTKKPAVCQVWSEDGAWVYDTYKVTYMLRENDMTKMIRHHKATFKKGKTMKVYATKEGMAKIKYHGRTAWISSKLIDVKKAGWIKLEGKWKKVKPGFDFLAYIKWGDEQND